MSNDTIDIWDQFGPDGTLFPDGQAGGVTQNAVTFTITGTNGFGFIVVTQPGTFNGQFAPDATMWLDTDTDAVSAPNYSGSVTLLFDTPIEGFDRIGLQSNLFTGTVPPNSPNVCTMDAYNGPTHLGASTYTNASHIGTGGPPTIPSFSFNAGSSIITKLVFSMTGTSQANPADSFGMVLGPAAISPPPGGSINTQGQIF